MSVNDLQSVGASQPAFRSIGLTVEKHSHVSLDFRDRLGGTLGSLLQSFSIHRALILRADADRTLLINLVVTGRQVVEQV